MSENTQNHPDDNRDQGDAEIPTSPGRADPTPDDLSEHSGAEQTPAAPAGAPSTASVSVSVRTLWAVGSIVGMLVGCVGTWVSVGPYSVAGTSGDADGFIVLGMAVVAGVLLAVRKAPFLVGLLGAFALATTVADSISVLRFDGGGLFSVSLGWGLILAVIASGSLMAWSVPLLVKSERRQKLFGGLALAAVLAAAIGLAGAQGRLDTDTEVAGGDSTQQFLSDSPDDESTTTTTEATETDPSAVAVDDTSLDDLEDSPSSDDAALDDTADDANAAAAKYVAYGQAGVDEDVTFKVVSFERVYSVPREYDSPITPSAGSKLYVAKVTWKNNTDNGIDIFCGGNGAVLLDDEDKNYDVDSDQIDLPGNEICGDDLQPGFKRTDSLLFKLPKSAKPSSLALWNSDSDEDSTGEKSYVMAGLD